MAWAFDETGNDVELSDDAALTLPDGDWTIAGWIKLDDNTGTGWQYFLSWNNFGVDPSINWYIGEATAPSDDAHELITRIDDADGDFVQISSTGEPFSSNTSWTHVALRRSSGTFTQWINGSQNDTLESSSGTVNAINVAGSLHLGSRVDHNAARSLGGGLAEFAKWDRALTSDEIDALAKGFAPEFFKDSLAWYVPMIREYDERMVPLTVTNNSSTVTDHPPIIYPVSLVMMGQLGPGQILTPSPADAVGARVNPAVILGSMTVTPNPADGVGATVNPTVGLGSLVIVPSPSDGVGMVIDPTVELGSLTITPNPADAVGMTDGPTVVIGGGAAGGGWWPWKRRRRG